MTRLAARMRDRISPWHPVGAPREHLDAAMEWLARAQDSTGTGGVARAYSLVRKPAHGWGRWQPAYPETTGYIIPTCLRYAAAYGRPEYRERALRMARWETEIQMESGAVRGGTIDFPPSPAIFNTGQVLFGWVSAYREFGDPSFLESARRAADFLVYAQDRDGAFRRHASRFAAGGVHVYDARTAWGLAETWAQTRDPRHRDAAYRNLAFAVSMQRPNGWFAHCCLDDVWRPLLHTLAYTVEGLLEAGCILEEERFIDSAERAAEALADRQRADGSLAGRFDAAWNPVAEWSCLTGDAQTSITWLRLHALGRGKRYYDAAIRMNRFLASTQDRRNPNPGIRGAIKGSHPIESEYGPYEYLNWAAKFFADSLMSQESTRADVTPEPGR